MSGTPASIPVVLFAYARPGHVRHTLDALRATGVPALHVFSDAPRTPDKAPQVEAVRRLLRGIDWCDLTLIERRENLGLGRSILSGMTEVFEKHEAAIIFEDDLTCVPGTYQYLCEALSHYRDDPRVMSVTGWTHPRVRPELPEARPYFDGRAECWSWGSWGRAWSGMQRDARSLLNACRRQGLDVFRYGYDLEAMALDEARRNLWAVRFALLHWLRQGLCLRPPLSMVNNRGFDADGTNSMLDQAWSQADLPPCPPIPDAWPEPIEDPACAALWRQAYPRPKPLSAWRRLRLALSRNRITAPLDRSISWCARRLKRRA